MRAPLNEVKRSTLEGCLRTMWRNAQYNRGLSDPPLPKRIMFRPDKLAVLTQPGMKAFDDSVETILSMGEVSTIFSKKRLEELTTESLFQVLDVGAEDIISAARQAVLDLETKLQAQSMEWKILFPISNLEMETSEVALGRVRFLVGEAILESKRQLEGLLLEIDPKKALDPKRKAEKIIASSLLFASSTLAEVSVTAVDPNQATTLADLELQNALAALRLIFAPVYRERRMFVDVTGRTWSTRLDLGVYSETAKEITMPQSIVGYFEPMHIASELANSAAFQKMHDILLKSVDKRSEMENRLIGAVRGFASALGQLDDRSAFVGIISSLEGFLFREYGPRKEPLSERLAFILETDLTSRRRIYARVKELYQLRSDVAHGKDVDVAQSDLQEITSFAYLCYLRALSFLPNFKELPDLLGWIESEKFS